MIWCFILKQLINFILLCYIKIKFYFKLFHNQSKHSFCELQPNCMLIQIILSYCINTNNNYFQSLRQKLLDFYRSNKNSLFSPLIFLEAYSCSLTLSLSKTNKNTERWKRALNFSRKKNMKPDIPYYLKKNSVAS